MSNRELASGYSTHTSVQVFKCSLRVCKCEEILICILSPAQADSMLQHQCLQALAPVVAQPSLTRSLNACKTGASHKGCASWAKLGWRAITICSRQQQATGYVQDLDKPQCCHECRGLRSLHCSAHSVCKTACKMDATRTDNSDAGQGWFPGLHSGLWLHWASLQELCCPLSNHDGCSSCLGTCVCQPWLRQRHVRAGEVLGIMRSSPAATANKLTCNMGGANHYAATSVRRTSSKLVTRTHCNTARAMRHECTWHDGND